MNKNFSDPNQEVESWKDKYYQEFKEIPASGIENYFEKEANKILEKYKIKCNFTKVIKKRELTRT